MQRSRFQRQTPLPPACAPALRTRLAPLHFRATSALICTALACSHGARPDLTPRLSDQAPRQAALQAALLDPGAGPALTPEEQIDHVLSRLTFGPRPGDRARVVKLGIAGFIEEQLHPERIDDAAVPGLEAQLAGIHVLHRSASQLTAELTAYREAQQKKREDEERARKQAAQAEEQRRRDEGERLVAGALPPGPLTAAEAARHSRLVDEAAQVAEAARATGPITAADAAELRRFAQLDRTRNSLASAVMPDSMRMMSGQPLAAGPLHAAKNAKSLPQRKMNQPRGPGFEYVLQLAEAKLVRAVSSQRQLEEVMADFWFNHFNVFAGKNEEAAYLPEYEREAIRAHALGTFPALLSATAHSPAMLVYLDNWISTAAPFAETGARRWYFRGDGSAIAVRRAPPNKRKAAGLNENYARELLELHTLGVDGGYTQKDVIEVARCFTGWTVKEPRRDPSYIFRPALHDDGPKLVLGVYIAPGGGERDGERVLDILAHHPSTARFIATKLARRFVSDDPPAELVDRVAATYARTGGDIRSMLRTIFESPEFWSRRALKAKMRSPLELVAGSIRALGATVDEPWKLAQAVARIGEPLYAAQPPTGYPDTEQGWASSGALLARIDFGLQLAMGQVEGVQLDLTTLAWGAKTPAEVLARAAERLSAGELGAQTRAYVLAELQKLKLDRRSELVAQRAVGLLLGAPELQRR